MPKLRLFANRLNFERKSKEQRERKRNTETSGKGDKKTLTATLKSIYGKEEKRKKGAK